MTLDLMPDFTDALEERLRKGPATTSNDRARPPWRWRLVGVRLALTVTACFALAFAMLILGVANNERTSRAYGKPPLLLTAPVDAPDVVRALQDGQTARGAFGASPRLADARSVPGFEQGAAFVVTGPSGWCLTVPDPSAGGDRAVEPLQSGAVTCAPTDAVYRYGIAIATNGNVVGALPAYARRPTLTSPDGTSQDLRPSDQGVVVASGVKPGSVLTLFAADGTTHQLRIG